MSATNTAEPRVAVVTGAGGGLGREFSRALLADGFAVALLGRTPRTLAESADGMPGSLCLRCDVTDERSVAEAFDRVTKQWGRLDVLVNNAGEFGPTGDIDRIDTAAWRHTLDVNLTGSFLCARRAFALMRAQRPQGGRIINNGSISAQVPRPGSVAYTASKHAITGLSRSLALDGRPYAIRCSQIDIGNAATSMTAAMGAGARQADGTVRPEPTFDARHAAEALVQIARLPLEVNIPTLTILASGMPFDGRG